MPPFAQTTMVLASDADLARFIRGGGWLDSRRQIELALPRFPSGAQRATERRLNFWRTVCGCLPASLTTLAVLVWRGSAALEAGQWFPAGAATEIAGVLLAGLAAKVIAVMLAKSVLAAELVLLWRWTRQSGRGEVQ